MNSSIVYFQESKGIAEIVKFRFSEDRDIEFIIINNAQDFFDIIKEKDNLLLIIDCSEPLDFIVSLKEVYPEPKMIVCVDRQHINMAPNIANIVGVLKVYITPVDIDEMEDGIRDCIDIIAVESENIRRQLLIEEELDNYELTINSLKEALIKQKYSYNKLSRVLDTLLETAIDINSKKNSEENENIEYYDYVRKACKRFLKINTTSSLETDKLSDLLLQEISGLIEGSNLELQTVLVSLEGVLQRETLARMIFCCYMILKCQIFYGRKGTVSIKSQYVSAFSCCLTVTVKGSKSDCYNEKIEEFTEKVIKDNSMGYNHKTFADVDVYRIEFEI